MSQLAKTYNQETDFTFDSNLFEWITDKLQLKLEDVSGQDFPEDFTDDTGHTYDPTLEFSGGLLQQINQRPTNALCFNNFKDLDSKINPQDFNWGDGVLTGTLNGGATILSDTLVTDGFDGKYASYPALNNTGASQTGWVEIDFAPQYSGAPASNNFIYSENGSLNSLIELAHLTTGSILVTIYDSSASPIINGTIVAFSPVAGTRYTIALGYNVTTGDTRLFIDGVQVGSTQTATGTRDQSQIANIYLGKNQGLTGLNDNIYYNVIRYDTVQHTSNYTPDWSSIPDADYLEGYDTLPEMAYTGAGALVSFDALTYTFTGDLLIALQIGQSGVWTYWNGSAWVTGNGTKDFMCSFTDFSSNVATLDIEGEIYGQFKIYFPITDVQGNIDLITASLTTQRYPLTNPSFVLSEDLTAEELLTASFTYAESGSDLVKGIVSQNSTSKYWNGTAWVTSDGTYSQSSLLSEITTNLATLNDGVINTYNLSLFLHSEDGSTTPSFSSISFTYNYSGDVPTVDDIRDFLEGYGITSTILSSTWVIKRRDNFVIPFVERYIQGSINAENTITEYLSGNGQDNLLLSSRDVTEIVSIEYVTGGDYDASLSVASLTLIPEDGIIKSIANITEGSSLGVFKKGTRNIKVVYKTGGATLNPDISEAVIYLCAEQALGFVGARTGGGAITVQGFSRSFGERGKYQDLRNDLKRQAMGILNKYRSHVVGNV